MAKSDVDYAFIADLDIEKVTKALEKIDAQVSALAIKLDKHFVGIERSASKSLSNLADEFQKAAKSSLVLASPQQSPASASSTRREEIALQREELRLEQEIEQAKLKTKHAAEQMIAVEIGRYPQLSAELSKLANKYGSLNVILGRSRNELSKEEKEVVDLIHKYPTLSAKIDETTKEHGELTMSLRRSSSATKDSSNSLTGFIGKLGLTGGSIYLLISNLRRLSRVAKETMQQIFVESIKTSQQFDQVRISLRSILDTQDADKMERLFTSIRQQSRGLGADIASVANAFLPLIDDIDQLEKIGESVKELVQLSVVTGRRQTTGDAIRAIAEAYSGDFISIRRLFELTNGEIAKLREGLAAGGEIGFLDSLDEVLTRRGIDIEEFRKTTQFQFSQLQEVAQDFRAEFGKPIDDSLAAMLERFGAFIEEHFDDLQALNKAIGEIIAALITDAGDTVLDRVEETDFDKMIDAVKALNHFIASLKSAKDDVGKIFKFLSYLQYLTAPGIIKGLDSLLGIETDTVSKIEHTDRLLTSVRQILTAITAEIHVATTAWGYLWDVVSNAPGARDISGHDALAAARKEVYDDYNAHVAEATELTEEFNTVIDKTRAGGKPFTNIDNITNTLKRLPETINEAKAEVERIEGEIGKDRLVLEEGLIQKRLEIERDRQRKEIDAEIDASEKREDIWRKYYDAIAKLAIKNSEGREDIELKYTRKLEDIDRKIARDQQSIERDSAKERIKIEQEYQQKLAEMRRQFLFDSEEAIRQNDALAFLRIKRKYEFQLNEARIAKDQEVEDAEAKDDEKRASLKAKRDQEIEDARIARQRSLEDLQTNIAREMAALRRSRIQDLRDAQIAEQRKREQLKKDYARRIEDFAEYQRQQREAFIRQHEDEFALLLEAEAKKTELMKREMELRIKLQQEFVKQMLSIQSTATSPEAIRFGQNTPEAGGGGTDDLTQLRDRALYQAERKNQLDQDLEREIQQAFAMKDGQKLLDLLSEIAQMPQLAGGGRTIANKSVIVGDGGEPEIFTPDRSGTVTPLSKLLQSYQHGANAIPIPSSRSGIDNSRSYNVDLSMLQPDSFTPGQLTIITQIVKQVLLEAS